MEPSADRISPAEARRAIRGGGLRGAAFLDALRAVPFAERDRWVDELLALPPLPDDLPGLPLGTIPYLPCDVDAITRAVLGAPLTAADVFIDLGAGLGRPVMLAHLLSGARGLGVELQSHLVDHARNSAEALGLDGVRFLADDATSVVIEDGTVFFVYASFNVAALALVLERLRQIAQRHAIVLCAVHFEVQGQPWLVRRETPSPDLVFYDSSADNA